MVTDHRLLVRLLGVVLGLCLVSPECVDGQVVDPVGNSLPRCDVLIYDGSPLKQIVDNGIGWSAAGYVQRYEAWKMQGGSSDASFQNIALTDFGEYLLGGVPVGRKWQARSYGTFAEEQAYLLVRFYKEEGYVEVSLNNSLVACYWEGESRYSLAARATPMGSPPVGAPLGYNASFGVGGVQMWNTGAGPGMAGGATTQPSTLPSLSPVEDQVAGAKSLWVSSGASAKGTLEGLFTSMDDSGGSLIGFFLGTISLSDTTPVTNFCLRISEFSSSPMAFEGAPGDTWVAVGPLIDAYIATAPMVVVRGIIRAVVLVFMGFYWYGGFVKLVKLAFGIPSVEST